MLMGIAGAFTASVSAILQNLDPPVGFDRVTVMRQVGGPLTGAYLGADQATVRLAVGNRLVSLPLAELVRYEVRAAPRERWKLPTLYERLQGRDAVRVSK